MDRIKGFTIIELVAGLLISGLVLSAATAFFLSGHKAAQQNREAAENQEQARYAMQFMLQEIRAASQILSLQPDSLTLVNHGGNKIVYQAKREVLYRDFYQRPSSTIMSTSHPLVGQVEDLVFHPSGINGIRVQLTIKQQDRSYPLETVVYPRVE
ncbi:MAG: prepilin-type N-terminal cleavage/methylation domain-containing protein [Syntrophomonadaceae bacterium]|nr:prepilin-type N-terminal cleavage/methylation domain-containing protein [Syntrophomonadaceae bacterium]